MDPLTCLESNSLHSVYSVMNFLARVLASMKPSDINIISQIIPKSGTTIAQGLKAMISDQSCIHIFASLFIYVLNYGLNY